MKKKRKYNPLILLVLFLTFVLIITRGYSLARYASNAVFNYYLSSKGFYFESKDLAFDTKHNVDTMWDGEKVYFTLTNSTNDALASEVDIKYEVKCVVNEEDSTKKCLLNGSDSDTLEATLSANFGCDDGSNSTEAICIENGHKWVSKPSTSSLYFEIVDTSGKDVLNADVTITVTSIKPYQKTLSASYSLIRDNSLIGSLSMKYEKGNLNSNLIVTNSYNEDKCVLVTWDPIDFIFNNKSNDAFNTTYDNDGNVNGVYFKINKMDSTTLEYYLKDGSVNYNELYFKLVESNLCD